MNRMCLPLALASILLAQHDGVHNPHQTAADIEAGGRIFRSHCAECHGLRGEGGRGPDLTQGAFRRGSSDAALRRTISEGVPGTEMPGIYFSDHQVWQIVAFVRALSSRPRIVNLAGSAAEGEKLFRKQGCGKCHMVRGEGGRLGPDLSHIGSARTAAHLRESIVNPQREVLPAYWQARAVQKDGNTVSGILLNEDHVSIQILDSSENLRSLLKRDLANVSIDKTSLMPPYAAALTARQLDDVVAYLASLREAEEVSQ